MSRHPSLTGGRVVLVWISAVLATAIVPPLAAREWHSRRVAETHDRLRTAAIAWTPGGHVADSIACGAGRRPGLSEATAAARGLSDHLALHEAWRARMTEDASWTDVAPRDAWGQCVVLRVSGDGRSAVLLSAGANGVIETALDATAPGGDDVLERVR